LRKKGLSPWEGTTAMPPCKAIMDKGTFSWGYSGATLKAMGRYATTMSPAKLL